MTTENTCSAEKDVFLEQLYKRLLLVIHEEKWIFLTEGLMPRWLD
jgi:hypothetical protein